MRELTVRHEITMKILHALHNTQKLLYSHSINPVEIPLSSSCIRPCTITLLLQYHLQEERKVKSSVVYYSNS